MNTEALFLFLILLLGLVLCSFLGGRCGNEGFTGNFSGTFTSNESPNTNGSSTKSSSSTNGASTSSPVNYDNYNHYSGSSTQLGSGTTFYGQNGGSVVVNTNSDGSQSLQITLANGQQPMTFSSQQSSSTKESYTNYYGNNASATTYYGPNGSTATIVNTNNGQQAVSVQTPKGSYTFTQSGASDSNSDNISSTQYYGSTGYHVNTYEGAYGGSAGAVTGPQGNTAYYAQGPNGNAVAGTSASSSNYDYSSSLPRGIPASQIPPGQEDLYILKSQVVPPVCPVCPTISSSSNDPDKEAKCPPCKPCGRCAEPSFECKKVPNYNAIDNQYLPQPVLNDFSTFGM